MPTTVELDLPTLRKAADAVLRDEGLVATRREGKQIHYRIDSPQAMAVWQVLHEQFCDPSKGERTC